MAEKPKIKLKDTVNPFAVIQATEDVKKKKKPTPPAPTIGSYAEATAKKLWPSAFPKK